jgi:hypothetical protein
LLDDVILVPPLTATADVPAYVFTAEGEHYAVDSSVCVVPPTPTIGE